TFNSNSISSASAHIDLYNRRDPRDPKWRSLWTDLANSALTDVATLRGRFTSLIQTNHSTEFEAWREDARGRLNALTEASTDQAIHDAFEQIATDFASRFGNLSDVRESAKQVLAALSEYSS